MSQHKAKKRFGQNFLHDPYVIQRILDAIHPKPGQNLVEIGPGLGALTCPLLDAIGNLHVVELDRDVIPVLSRNCGEKGALRVYNEDALKFDFRTLFPEIQTFRLVGNLPYNISTPLIFHLLTQAERIDDMHFMLQKEVVDRMAASPGGKEYGRLTVMLQYQCEVEHLFDVGPGAFNPPPKVDSAIVRLIPRETPAVQVDDEPTFASFVLSAFTQRRKTLRKILKKQLSAEAIEALGQDPMMRPDHLSLQDFADLSNGIYAAAPTRTSSER